MSRPRAPEGGQKRLRAWLVDRYAEDLAAGWVIAAGPRRGSVVLVRGDAVRDVEIPPHVMPVADALAWHRDRQAGRPIGLPLFDELDTAGQGRLL